MAESPVRGSLEAGAGGIVRRKSIGITTSSQTAAAQSSPTRWPAAWGPAAAGPSSPDPGPSGLSALTGENTRKRSRTSRDAAEKVTTGDKLWHPPVCD